MPADSVTVVSEGVQGNLALAGLTRWLLTNFWAMTLASISGLSVNCEIRNRTPIITNNDLASIFKGPFFEGGESLMQVSCVGLALFFLAGGGVQPLGQ